MFHYGIAGWSVYALLGMAMGYFSDRWGMPLSIRAALYPLLGKRVRGPLGDGISTFSLVGRVFGVATSMGIGVVLLNVGFARLFGLEQGQDTGRLYAGSDLGAHGWCGTGVLVQGNHHEDTLPVDCNDSINSLSTARAVSSG